MIRSCLKVFILFCGASSATEGLDLSGDGIYHMKILIPSLVAGSIIGKGGETIGQLQKDTNTKIKMSKANDFYPGMLHFLV